MGSNAASHIERGRAAYRERAWNEAYRSLSRADAATPLDIDDLEFLAWSAAAVGRDDEFLQTLDRVFHRGLETGHRLRAARAGFWLAVRLFFLGEPGRATGWLSRSRRIVEDEATDCVERGYLLMPAALQALATSHFEEACASAETAEEIGMRFDDADLVALARTARGRALIRQGKLEDGIALLDEAMLAASEGTLSPMVTGIVYCDVIAICQKIYAVDRSREWTAALAAWCEAQPELVAFTGICRVHRAEILHVAGAWPEAIAETHKALAALAETKDRDATAAAHYQDAEIRRLRGEHAGAEQAYHRAGEYGFEPQPGLALLRLAQGRPEAAAAAIRRALTAVSDPLQRAKLLPAYVEIMLAAGALAEADAAGRELAGIAERFRTDVLGAMATHARGAVRLAAGEPQAALAPLRHAFEVWSALDAPYLGARVRVAMGRACRALDDHDGARLEFAAARAVFERLGAGPDLLAVDEAEGDGAPAPRHRLTPREVEVLRLVAAGNTNKQIARDLELSERTIDRHVSNIFDKLEVSSRSAATAYACQAGLV